MMKTLPATGRPVGVYLGLPSDEYHADPALGSGDLRLLAANPTEFHYYWPGNPSAAESRDTEALTFGRALHLMVLEGKRAFAREFLIEPTASPGEIMLVTADDLKGFLRGVGLEVSGNVDVLVKRVRAHIGKSNRVRIFREEIDEAKANGLRVLKPDAWERIAMAATHISGNPHLARSFVGGDNEVSVFAIREAIRVKGRFDCVRVVVDEENKRLGMISDLKSFSNPLDRTLDEAITAAVKRNLVQVKHYMTLFHEMREMIDAGAVYGLKSVEQEKRLKRVARCGRVEFGFVFYKSQGAPYAEGRVFQEINRILDDGQSDIDIALVNFRKFHERFGPDLPWVNVEPPRETTRDDLSRGRY